jgi:hypothetical protein
MASTRAKIKLRRGTNSEFVAANTVLRSGEPGFATDTKELKIGDGTTSWASLDSAFVYSVTAGITGGAIINNVVKISQVNYDNLATKDANTLYLIG